MDNKRLVYIGGLSNDTKIGSYVRQDMSNLKAIFEDYENEGKIILRTDEYITTRALSNRFSDTQILPWLFYFSGHSDVNQIQMSDGIIEKERFANIFDEDKITQNLQLVYLSSCSSTDIADALIDKKVKVVIASIGEIPAGLANTLSHMFFNQFLFSENIQKAFDRAKNQYLIDRSKFNVNQQIDFPWILRTSNESNPYKPLQKMNLSPEQKHQILLNSTSIRLQQLNYYFNEDKSDVKRQDLIQQEVEEIQQHIGDSITVANDKKENISTLVDVWKGSTPLQALPNSSRFLKADKSFSALAAPDRFQKKTETQLTTMLEEANQIIQ